jgi:hypothetical protein
MGGLITKTLDWITHPSKSEGTPGEWLAGLVLIMIVSFLWVTVTKQIE